MVHKAVQDEFEDFGLLAACYYCGQPCDSVDHVTPRTVLAMIGNEFKNPVSSRVDTVDACRECNSALGSRVYNTLADRKQAAQDHIRKKYGKYLHMPDWSEMELEELGHTLRSHIKKSMAIKKLTKMRLAW